MVGRTPSGQKAMGKVPFRVYVYMFFCTFLSACICESESSSAVMPKRRNWWTVRSFQYAPELYTDGFW